MVHQLLSAHGIDNLTQPQIPSESAWLVALIEVHNMHQYTHLRQDLSLAKSNIKHPGLPLLLLPHYHILTPQITPVKISVVG